MGRRKKGTTELEKCLDSGGCVSFETLDKVFEMYFSGVTHQEISERTGLAIQTIRKYIYQGRPDIGLEPLRDRKNRIYRRLIEDRDSAIVSRLSRASESVTQALEVAARRYIDRVLMAAQLDNPAISEDESKMAAIMRSALNPDVEDLEMLSKAVVAAEEARNGGKATTPQINLSVAQMQDQATQSSSTACVGDIDGVVEYVEMMRNNQSPEIRRSISKLVESTNEKGSG